MRIKIHYVLYNTGDDLDDGLCDRLGDGLGDVFGDVLGRGDVEMVVNL